MIAPKLDLQKKRMMCHLKYILYKSKDRNRGKLCESTLVNCYDESSSDHKKVTVHVTGTENQPGLIYILSDSIHI